MRENIFKQISAQRRFTIGLLDASSHLFKTVHRSISLTVNWSVCHSLYQLKFLMQVEKDLMQLSHHLQDASLALKAQFFSFFSFSFFLYKSFFHYCSFSLPHQSLQDKIKGMTGATSIAFATFAGISLLVQLAPAFLRGVRRLQLGSVKINNLDMIVKSPTTGGCARVFLSFIRPNCHSLCTSREFSQMNALVNYELDINRDLNVMGKSVIFS